MAGYLIAKKVFLTVGAIFVGPAIIILSLPLVNWSVAGGFSTMAILSGMAILNVWKKNASNNSTEVQPPQNFFARSWRGEEALWKVFWIGGLGLEIPGLIVAAMGTTLKVPLIWWYVAVLLKLLAQSWWIVAVWRCSQNTSSRIWFWLSRVLALLATIRTTYLFWDVFFGD